MVEVETHLLGIEGLGRVDIGKREWGRPRVSDPCFLLLDEDTRLRESGLRSTMPRCATTITAPEHTLTFPCHPDTAGAGYWRVMSQDAVKRVREGYEAFSRSGVEAILEFVHPDFEGLGLPQYPEWSRVQGRGRAGLEKWFGEMTEVWEELRFEPQEVFEAEDKVVAFVRTVARGKGSGIELDQLMAHVWTLRDGQGVRMEAFASRAEALEAVGLRE